MRYREFIERYFLIDEPKSGELVPFKFNKVQEKYYNELCLEYGLEEFGIVRPVRENILKARREGFSSLILAIFAADDIMQNNPTETAVLSYKEDATKVFRRRYRTYVLSYFARRTGHTIDTIRRNPGILDEVAKHAFIVDSTEIVFKHNSAHFYCGTASAKTGGRGGVVQKLLFSEMAHYPDGDKATAKEIIEGTMRQVDIDAGWIFAESTANGKGTYQHRLWMDAEQKRSRFANRFYGWREFYSDEDFLTIASEFVDKDMLRQEYPETSEEAFVGADNVFCTSEDLLNLQGIETEKELVFWMELPGVNYIEQCEIITSTLEMLEKEYEYCNLFVGIDVAKVKDATVITVILTRSDSYVNQGGVKAIAIDSTGIGDFMPDWFERNTRWYIEKVKFTAMMKDIMYKNLLAVIKNQETSLPILLDEGAPTSDEADKFLREMTELQKTLRGSMMQVSHPKGDRYHDDYPDSFALAEHAYRMIIGRQKRKAAPEVFSMRSRIGDLLASTSGSEDYKAISHYE